MTRLIGYFDDRDRANECVASLTQKSLVDEGTAKVIDNSYGGAHGTPGSPGFMGALKDLFGMKSQPQEDTYCGYYAETIRRGHVLVCVDTADDLAERAADLMSSMGAIDVDQREAYLRDSGFDQFDGGAVAFTQDEASEDRRRFDAWQRAHMDTAGVNERRMDSHYGVNRGGIRMLRGDTEGAPGSLPLENPIDTLVGESPIPNHDARI